MQNEEQKKSPVNATNEVEDLMQGPDFETEHEREDPRGFKGCRWLHPPIGVFSSVKNLEDETISKGSGQFGGKA